jgi:hypothetical protein
MNQKSIRYNYWEIPQLIHLISSALEMSQTVDEFRDDKFFECMREGRSGDSTEAASSFPLFSLKRLSSRANPPLSFTDI